MALFLATLATISSAFATQLTLTWTDNSVNEVNFRIERRLTSGVDADFVEIDTVGRNIVTYTDTTVTAGVDYTYRVRASNSTGFSAYTSNANRIAKDPQTINLPGIADKIFGDPDFSPGATATSGLAVTYTSSNPAVATISVLNEVHIVGVGTTTITADQIGNGLFLPAPSVGDTFEVFATAVTFNTQPATQTVLAGANVTLSVSASGSPPLSYQWKKNGTNISGATSSSLSFSPATVGDAGTYSVRVSNSLGFLDSADAILTVNAPPAFTTHPTTQSVTTGGNVTLTIVATGSPAPSIQWQKNGVNLVDGGVVSGATTASLTLTGLSTADAGTYTAVATNVVTSTTSSGAVLTVNVPPAITTHPTTQTVNAGAIVNLTVAATGQPAPTFQWKKGGVNLVDGGIVSGATSTTLTLTGVGLADAGTYTAVATNVAGNATTNDAVLTVNTAPAFTTHPTTQSVTTGGNVTLTVVVTGSPAPTIQWQKNGTNVTDGGVVSGATTASLTLTGLSAAEAGIYTAVATNVVTSTTSDGAVLTVNVPPAFTTHPTTQTVAAGVTVNLTVAVTGQPVPTIQWKKNGTDLVNGGIVSGATSTTLTLTGVGFVDGGTYTAVASNGVGSPVTSNDAVLTVNAPPTFTAQPASISVMTGTNATLSATVTGSLPITLQWKKNGIDIPGATSATLPLGVVTTAASGTYTLVATNAFGGPVTSTGAVLTVTEQPTTPPVITSPSSTGGTVGAPFSYQITANNGPSAFAVGGTLPAGLTFTPSSGVISGTPTATGIFGLSVSAFGATATANGTLTITITGSAPGITSPLSASGTIGIPFSYQISGTNSPNSFAVAGTLPAGLTFAASSGLISGTPTATGTSSVTISAITGGGTANATLTITINPAGFTGYYFGAFAGNQGTWALYVRSDGTGVFIATIGTAVVVQEVTISPDGTFTFTATTANETPVGSNVAEPGAQDSDPSKAAAVISFTGQISGGQVAGQSSSGVSFTGTKDSAASQNPSTGFYVTPALGVTPATTYAIVGPSGLIYTAVVSTTTSQSASGTLNSAGQFSGTTTNGSQIAVGANNSTGSLNTTVTAPGSTPVVFMGTNDAVPSTTRLANLSARAPAGSDSDTLIVGFIVNGASKSVLVRGVGPTLADFNVPGFTADPRLALYRGNTLIESNDNWGGGSALRDTFNRVGAFPMPDASRDAAVLSTLTPQAYTALVTGSGGVALAEIYDADVTSPAAGRLVNLSARARVGTGDAVIIVGFAVPGNAPKAILLRAVGPELTTRFGLSGSLSDPKIDLYQGSTVLHSNDNWGGASNLSTAFNQVGAFGYSSATSRDAALLVIVAPGVYTAVVSGVGGTTGIALVEIYEMP